MKQIKTIFVYKILKPWVKEKTSVEEKRFGFINIFGTTQVIWPFSSVLAPHLTSASAHMIGFVVSHLF